VRNVFLAQEAQGRESKKALTEGVRARRARNLWLRGTEEKVRDGRTHSEIGRYLMTRRNVGEGKNTFRRVIRADEDSAGRSRVRVNFNGPSPGKGCLWLTFAAALLLHWRCADLSLLRIMSPFSDCRSMKIKHLKCLLL
jgi:hypothetical protein